eukprot:2820591-Alexandrium_andersonii.AAC.1
MSAGPAHAQALLPRPFMRPGHTGASGWTSPKAPPVPSSGPGPPARQPLTLASKLSSSNRGGFGPTAASRGVKQSSSLEDTTM